MATVAGQQQHPHSEPTVQPGPEVGERRQERDAGSPADERASIAASQTSTVETVASTSSNMIDPLRDDAGSSSQSSLGPEEGDRDRTGEMDVDTPIGAREVRVNGDGLHSRGHGEKEQGRMNGLLARENESMQPAQGHGPGEPLRIQTERLTNGNGTHSDLRQGQKRTASGHVKTPTPTTAHPVPSPSRERSQGPGHKRNVSTNTQVNELSAQLRARLSYAMLKVQNGWESRTLDEIEVLASQHGSPMALTSPWRASASTQASRHPVSAAATQASHALNGSLKHENSTYQHPSTSSAPILAPPVDFDTSQTNPRRTSMRDQLPPYLSNGNTASNHSTTSAASFGTAYPGTIMPATPPLQENPTALQTPSQRATASERDAIETLLFMSSPGNSQTFRQASSQPLPLSHALHQSPPRPALSVSPQKPRPLLAAKQVTFTPSASNVAALAVEAADRVPLSPRKRGLLDSARLESEASIDRVLDLMPAEEDGDSSSDESLGSVGPGSAHAERSVIVR